MGTGCMLGVLKLQVAGGMEVLGSESRSVLEQRQESLPMRQTLAGAPGLLYRRDSTPQIYPFPHSRLLLMATAEVSQCVC